jgi:hypothetical protein
MLGCGSRKDANDAVTDEHIRHLPQHDGALRDEF